MPWDQAFIDQLLPGATRAPRYLLESEAIPQGTKPWGGTLMLSSFSVDGYTPVIAERGHSISFGELSVRDWTATRGTLTIAVIGSDIRQYISRGQVLALRVGFDADVTTFEPVFRGAVRSLRRGADAVWLLQLEEITGALRSRFVSAAGETPLFWDLASTTLTSGIGPGHTTVPVVDATDFREDGGGVGAILIAGSDGPFIDFYTGTTGVSFTGATEGELGSDPDGSLVAAAPVSAIVSEVAYMVGHPIVVALRILHSTGGGTNGNYDTLPESWGYALPRSMVDQEDARFFKGAMLPTGGTTDWHVFSTTPQVNGLGWLQGWMASAGMFITMRQGEITVRCGVLPWVVRTPGHIDISPETGLARIDAYDTFDPSTPMEFSTVEIERVISTHALVTSTEDVENLPDGGTLVRPAPFAALGTIAESTDWRQEIGARVSPWDLRTAERVEVAMAGWWAGQAAPGDTCTLDARRFGLTDRYGAEFDGTREGLVLSAQPNWFGATTRVVVAFLPYDDEETP
jgi:hypothetical protein